MLKRIMVLMVVCTLGILQVAPAVMAQTTAAGPTGTAKAFVENMLEFSMQRVVKMTSGPDETRDPWANPPMVTPLFDFGTLEPVYDTDTTSETYGQFLYMRGQYYYYVLLLASTSGRKYKITETGSQLISGTSTIANESVLLIPDYQELDELGGIAQGACPGTVGPVTTATTATEKLVYQSDGVGKSVIVRSIVAITGPAAGALEGPFNYSKGYNGENPAAGGAPNTAYSAWKPVPLSQKGGLTYSGKVTFTLVLN